jgi:hypothetical protein
MQKAFIVLGNALREAEGRLRKCEAEGDKSSYKLPAIRHDIRELEAALAVLKYTTQQSQVLRNLWQLIEEGSKASVQIHSNTGKRPASGRSRSNRRRT